MITETSISFFKCFQQLKLSLAPLTLLTGYNAGGKSTVIQSLLLLGQSLRNRANENFISLNGSLTRLGTTREILHGDSRNPCIAISTDSAALKIVLSTEDRRSGRLPIESAESRNNVNQATSTGKSFSEIIENAGEIPDTLKNIVFISAIRSDFGQIFPSPDDLHSVHADVGVSGEFAPWWLASFSDEDVDEKRRHPDENNVTLRAQVNAWASTMFPNAGFSAGFVDSTDLVRFTLRRSNTEEWRRPSNIGYGLTYAFPIIVAGLLTKPGQILIIDSPEAHLHPKAQSMMARFLANVVAAGVQVIIETHSDHILNGIRISTKEGVLTCNDAIIYFFTGEPETKAQIISTTIDDDGNICDWPDGFFDQAEKDLSILAGWN